MQKLVFPFNKTQHLGIFETPTPLAEFLIKNSMELNFAQTKSNFLEGLLESDYEKVEKSLQFFLNFTACDPMMGSGIFVQEMIVYLEELRNWFIAKANELKLNSQTIKKHPIIFQVSQEQFLEHLLINTLYGVELNNENHIKCKTFLQQLLPNNKKNICDLNFKKGNSIIDCLTSNFYKELTEYNREEITTLLILRKKLKNREKMTKKELNQFTKIKSELYEKIKQKSPLNEIPQNMMPEFFSWPLEFPEIFFNKNGDMKSTPGFNVVIGNPPWKVLKPDDREFFEKYIPGFSTLKRIQRDSKKEKLITNPEIISNYKSYLESIKHYARYFIKSGAYNFQGGGGVNLYKVSLERFYQLTSKGGFVAAVVPVGIATDLGSSTLRKFIFEHCTLYLIIGFEPKSKFFSNADVSPSVCVFKKGGSTKKFVFANGFISPQDVKIEKLPKISVNFIQKTSPTSLSIPSIKSKLDISILDKMYSFPILGIKTGDEWDIETARELDETNDRRLFRTQKTNIPLIKGGNISPFKMKKPPFIWVDEAEFKKISNDSNYSRVVWRDVARPNLKNRLIATLIKPGCALGNSLNYIKPNIPENLKYFLLGFLNSSIAEYRIRQLTSNSHINQFVIKQLPIPRLSFKNTIFQKISKLSKELHESDLTEAEFSTRLKEIDDLMTQVYNLNFEESEHINKIILHDNP